jgi:type I restriction enzyme S subunit
VGIGATLGKTAVVTEEIAVNQQCHAVLVGNERDAILLREILNERSHLFWRRAGSGGMPILPKASFAKTPIPWPDESTRNQVYKSLTCLTAARSKYTALIGAKRTIKRALMQQLLTGRKRFPEYRDSEWVEVHLGEIFEERIERNRPDLPLLSVTNDRGVIPRDELVKRDTSNPDKSKYKRVAVGDIAYNTMRMWQGVSALSSLEGIISPAYTVAVPTDRICGHFAKHLFKYPPVINLFHRYSQGLVDDTLNLKFDRFSKIKLKIPRSTGEQSRIGAVLDLCDAELDLIEAQRRQFESYKRGLLSRLLNGELEIPDPS